MADPITHRFEACELWIWPETEYIETRFPGGLRVGATRDCELGNLTYARHIGYPDCWTALLCHEACHTFIAERMGHRVSPTLYAHARGCTPDTAPYEVRLYEEAVVLSFERWYNLGAIAPVLEHPEIRFHLPRWRDQWAELRANLLSRVEAA